jgi:multidrug transporter EmrE-like cation transporter
MSAFATDRRPRPGFGTAYAVWTGIGTVVMTVLGLVLFRESASALRLLSIALIVVGIVGLEVAPASSAAVGAP